MNPPAPHPDQRIDARGLNCPLPILRAKKALATLGSGQLLEVLTTDAHAERDFQAFCQQTGNRLLRQEKQDDAVMAHYIERR
ncbi:sulfurtransferase TusA family protein [Castellaniella sp.]|uniref:sulfurtransferase TusA family protein n=1 Tax=Castellaniella sp. TaxID=1955812 RepID=UPI003567599A